MAKAKRSLEERMLEIEQREQATIEKAKRYEAQKRELKKQFETEQRKKRTHRLCVIGGAVESVLGTTIEENDIPKLIAFLNKQESNGNYFSKAMQKNENTEKVEV